LFVVLRSTLERIHGRNTSGEEMAHGRPHVAPHGRWYQGVRSRARGLRHVFAGVTDLVNWTRIGFKRLESWIDSHIQGPLVSP
jgi:hypothetical protein